MPCKQINTAGVQGILCTAGEYKAGDPAPAGYLAWHEWAEIQHQAGLRQKECGRCGKWRFPQELSDQWDRTNMQSRKGPVTLLTPVCLQCLPKQHAQTDMAQTPKVILNELNTDVQSQPLTNTPSMQSW